MHELYPQHSGLDPQINKLIDNMKTWNWLIHEIPVVRFVSKLFPHEQLTDSVKAEDTDLLPTGLPHTLEE